eukprot:1163131-Prymnesium_polylepis.1
MRGSSWSPSPRLSTRRAFRNTRRQSRAHRTAPSAKPSSDMSGAASPLWPSSGPVARGSARRGFQRTCPLSGHFPGRRRRCVPSDGRAAAQLCRVRQCVRSQWLVQWLAQPRASPPSVAVQLASGQRQLTSAARHTTGT